MAAKFEVGDMVRIKATKEAQFLGEKIEGIVVKIAKSSNWNQYCPNQLYLYLIQDSRGAHYMLIEERYLEPSNAPRFEPKRLRKGCLVSLSPHSTRKNLLCRKKHYSVKEVYGNMATLILGEGKTINVHAENLKIVR